MHDSNRANNSWLGTFAGKDLAQVAETARRATIEVRGRQGGCGSGVIWRRNGLVVTNAHVVRGRRRVEVKLADGQTLSAALVRQDEARDLALLQLERAETSELSVAMVGDSDRLRTGELVFAVGHPFGVNRALTVGIVHSSPGVEKEAQTQENFGGLRLAPAPPSRRWIAADVRLAPGNSGGPLANALGLVIGINTMIAHGLGLAVPSNAVNSFVRRFERRGQQSPRIGVDLVAVSVPVESEAALGLMIMQVAANSLAEQAGLLIGDVIVGANNRFFRAADDLASAWDEALERSSVLKLNLLRGGELIMCDVAAALSDAQKAEAA